MLLSCESFVSCVTLSCCGVQSREAARGCYGNTIGHGTGQLQPSAVRRNVNSIYVVCNYNS